MRTRIRPSFLHEVERFERCCDGHARTQLGLEQFHAYESRGIQPDRPDPYFRRLLDGKRWWEWTVNEYAGLWGTWEWPGWLMLRSDFSDDMSGLRQIARRIGIDLPPT